MEGKPDRPRLVAFELTRRCRFNCRYCRAGAGPQGGDGELSTSQCKKILAAVAKFTKCTMIYTGGEPMERSDIYELIEYGRSLKLRVVMATCGYLINDDSIARLKRAGVLALSFSLDGASAETHDALRQARGAFDATIKATETAKKAGVPFQINTTISNMNIDESLSIAETAERLGANCFNAFIFVPTGRGEELPDAVLDPIEYETLLNELLRMKVESKIEVRVTCAPQFARVCRQQKLREMVSDVHGCLAGTGFGFISYKGDVQTCGFLNVAAGNLVENKFDFGKIWRESEFLNEIRDVSNYRDKCGECDYLEVCGGCRARAFAASGDYLGGDPVCRYRRGTKK